ncbi:head GIN domain-containing protein [Aquimarina sp. I32.4]|uniref:head GIN domain-containing protein n=1 Tax=Aquimarina sp. I32.4 TaxID=2053903 RepID=UPI000CDE7BFA|nr:head GIN domain-containing protein [Aquimarina sp. I32.4]
MKIKTILFVLSFVLSVTTSLQAQWFGSGKRIKGNRDYVTKNRTTNDYDKIKVKGNLDISLIYGTEGKIKIEGESNLIPYILTEIEDSVLKIYIKKGYNISPSLGSKLLITVPFKDINGVYMYGSGDISGTDLIKASDFTTKISGSGDILLAVNAKNVTAQITGSGDLVLKGDTQNFEGRVTGSGDLSAYDLNAENVTAMVSGSGDIETTASLSIKARVSGSGDITYKGNPKKEDKKVSGSGDITKR